MKHIYFTTTTFLFLAIDLISKGIVENTLSSEIILVPGIISLQKVYNTGIAFSLYVPTILLQLLTVLLIFGIICYYFHKNPSKKYSLYDLGFSLIIGGALGNASGRILEGKVLDFISVEYFSVLNIADIWISLGALCLIYWHYKNDQL